MTLLRQADNGDVPALERFLASHPETSMFLRGNLEAHGIGSTDHRHGATYWLHERDGIAGVVACTNGGYLMCQAPHADATVWRSAVSAVAGRRVAGITGVPDQVNAWADALGLTPDAFSVKETEPLYRLKLDDLSVPDVAGLHLRKPHGDDIPTLVDWFDGYARDTGIAPTDGASGQSAAGVFADHPAARILERGGAAVAMASLNARAAETVQVGGVYVPPAVRGQGLAGAVVALQLAELRELGAQVAILFAANAAAARAYERIGFQQIGSYEVALLKTPIIVEEVRHVFQT